MMSSKKLSVQAIFIVLVLLLSGKLSAKTKKPKKFIQSLESVQIKSIKQQMLDQHHFVFEEEVEVLVDKTVHIWADRVEVDKQRKILVAKSVYGSPIKIETNDFLILSDTFTLNVTEKTGSADNIKIHVREGYMSASKAEKLSENRWSMKNIVYTPCDAQHSHWHLSARCADVYGGIFIKLTGVLFQIMNIPVFGLPYMLFPIQGGSRSGFLIPKFYFDYDFGFGTKIEYYQYFGPRCDTTIGIDWQDRKGFVVSDEFRWARSPESYSLINSYFAVAKNSFSRECHKIVRTKKNRYWVAGVDFRNTSLFGAHMSSLARADLGTDKRIGYQFFNNLKDIDDEFMNTWMFRFAWPHDQCEVRIDGIKTSRKRFSELTCHEKELFSEFAQTLETEHAMVFKDSLIQKRELENRVDTSYLPHLEWNRGDYILGNHFYYGHDLMADHSDYHECELERLYFNSFVEREERIIPRHHAHMLRVNYTGHCGICWDWCHNAFSFILRPVMQMRTQISKDEIFRKRVFEHRVQSYGAARYFFNYAAEWALPEITFTDNEGLVVQSVQPVFSWDYVPTFEQRHWFAIDEWDTWYARNELALDVRYNGNIRNNIFVDLNFRQAYDFNKSKDLFPLKRSVRDTHWLPCEVHASVSSEMGNLSLSQEYDLLDKRLLHSLLFSRFQIRSLRCGLGYLYQHTLMQEKRGLLSNIPHFFLCELAVPLTKELTLKYDGQFYSETGQHIFGFTNFKPLLHRVRLDYSGHCWGFYIGYEEKRYREHGVSKGERAFVFSLRLDSLGSFAKKFRNQEVVRDYF